MGKYEFLPYERLVLVGMMNRIELWKYNDWKKAEENMQRLFEPYWEDIENLLGSMTRDPEQ